MEAEIEKLLKLIDQIKLQPAQPSASPPGDAIDQELGRPPESTATVSLRQSEVVKAFEQAAADAHIEADVLRTTLLIVHDVLSRALLPV